jgi:NADPH-dependent ferric siderophore reductase
VLPERGWRFPGGIEQHWRNFTVRRHDRAAATIDVEFFLHGDIGIASAWAARARVGDAVGFAGPRTHWVPTPAADWCLLVADETGLPALLAILESLPRDVHAIAIAEVGDERERQRDDVRWAIRNGDPIGAALLRAVREVELPDGPGQVWGGGESRVMAKVCRHARAAAPHATLQVLGYWAT